MKMFFVFACIILDNRKLYAIKIKKLNITITVKCDSNQTSRNLNGGGGGYDGFSVIEVSA